MRFLDGKLITNATPEQMAVPPRFWPNDPKYSELEIEARRRYLEERNNDETDRQ
jgi:rRNA maturation protein Nop10